MSFYTTFSNKNADGTDVTPWQAAKDIFFHPLDSLRSFVAAPFALVAGTASGMDTLPSVQATVAEVVTSFSESRADQATPASKTESQPQAGLPTWVKFTIAAAAIAGAVVVVKGAMK